MSPARLTLSDLPALEGMWTAMDSKLQKQPQQQPPVVEDDLDLADDIKTLWDTRWKSAVSSPKSRLHCPAPAKQDQGQNLALLPPPPPTHLPQYSSSRQKVHGPLNKITVQAWRASLSRCLISRCRPALCLAHRARRDICPLARIHQGLSGPRRDPRRGRPRCPRHQKP